MCNSVGMMGGGDVVAYCSSLWQRRVRRADSSSGGGGRTIHVETCDGRLVPSDPKGGTPREVVRHRVGM